MIKINNYILDLKQSIISFIASSSLGSKISIISQFNKIQSLASSPLISICIDKISISPLGFDNYINNQESLFYKTNINLSFLIYVPLKLGANMCYDIFYELSDTLLKNSKKLKNFYFSSMHCNNIEFQKSNNSFLLTAVSSISVIPE
ncbi:MAG: hypothetical protein J6C55_01855 [Oscillospiraceae bacterium]|nr:hypothetical protein [Oscillospiraceae bacterium]